jgi:hypothetical protein
MVGSRFAVGVLIGSSVCGTLNPRLERPYAINNLVAAPVDKNFRGRITVKNTVIDGVCGIGFFGMNILLPL